MINTVLSAKENGLSSNNYRNSYAERKDWVYNQIYRVVKRNAKFEKRLDKSRIANTKQIKKATKGKTPLNPNNLKDGWYKGYVPSTTEFKRKDYDLLLERYFQIYNHKVINYIGLDNILFNATSKNVAGKIRISMLYPDGTSSSYFEFEIFDSNPIKDLPEFFEPQIVIIYTNEDNGGGDILVDIKKNLHFGFIKNIHSTKPKCNESSGIVKLYLPMGKYEYYAYNDLDIWEGSFNVKPGCNTLRLNH